ncbi:MAG: hypothetical protein ACI85O_002769 [Saprospiraceae bacterium]|jgi:hypothetical protein
MKLLKNISFLLVPTLLLLASCSQEQLDRLEPIPSAYGNVNSVIVIADETTIESAPGDTLIYYLEAAYPILPQPEPLFSVRVYSPLQVLSKKERKELRSYIIIADMSQKESAAAAMISRDLGPENVRKALETKGYGTKVVKNRWADGQILVYVFGKDEDALLENVQRSFPGILQRINEHDSKQVKATAYFQGENKGLQKEILDSLGIKIELPQKYQKAAFDRERNTYWLRFDYKEYIYNILIHKEEYTDEKQFTRENLIAMRNAIGQLIATDTPDSRMVVNYTDLPLYVKGATVNGNFALEAKGIWEIENDFMGGPFVSYLIHNPNNNELVLVDGFLFGPGKKKRDAIQTLENIIKTTSF